MGAMKAVVLAVLLFVANGVGGQPWAWDGGAGSNARRIVLRQAWQASGSERSFSEWLQEQSAATHLHGAAPQHPQAPPQHAAAPGL